jgi:hypothetical protein
MLASPLMLVEGIRFRFDISEMDVWTGLGGVVYMLGALASVVGLRRLRATGDGQFAARLFWAQVVLLCTAIFWSAGYAVGLPVPMGTLLWRITDASWPLSHLSMLLLGAGMIRAGQVHGWRRFPALACGGALPMFFALTPLGVPRTVASAGFGILTMLGFLGLGYVVRSSGRTASARRGADVRRPAPAAVSAGLVALVAALVLAPSAAEAQGGLVKQMKAKAKERAAAAAARAAAAAVVKSGEVADTTLAVGVAGADSVTDRVAGAMNSLTGRMQAALPGALGGRRPASTPPASAVAPAAAPTAADTVPASRPRQPGPRLPRTPPDPPAARPTPAPAAPPSGRTTPRPGA